MPAPRNRPEKLDGGHSKGTEADERVTILGNNTNVTPIAKSKKKHKSNNLTATYD